MAKQQHIRSYNALSEEEFDSIIENGFKDFEEGNVLSGEDVLRKMNSKYEISKQLSHQKKPD